MPISPYYFRVEEKQIEVRSEMVHRSWGMPLEERWEETISELIEWFVKNDTEKSKARIAQLCAIVAYADSNRTDKIVFKDCV